MVDSSPVEAVDEQVAVVEDGVLSAGGDPVGVLPPRELGLGRALGPTPERDVARLGGVGVLLEGELVEGGGEGQHAQLARAVAGVQLVVGPAL